jgi:hypothetical protein
MEQLCLLQLFRYKSTLPNGFFDDLDQFELLALLVINQNFLFITFCSRLIFFSISPGRKSVRPIATLLGIYCIISKLLG